MPTIKPTDNVINDIITFYTPYKKEKTPNYAVISASYNDTTITVYTSGKVLFQGKNADTEASRWSTAIDPSKQNNSLLSTTDLPESFDALSVIGSDEVGNGSYFGSLTVCAAFVRKDQIEQLKQMGVKDSKLLNDTKIRELAEKLKSTIPYELIDVTPYTYNKMTLSYGFNAVSLKVWNHTQAINKLAERINLFDVDAVLIDQFVQKSTFFKYLNELDQTLLQLPFDQNNNVYFKTKGEQYHMAVASASIIARAAFLDNLDLLSDQLKSNDIDMDAPSGSGDTPNIVAAEIINQLGSEQLAHYVKLHFANTQKAEALAKI